MKVWYSPAMEGARFCHIGGGKLKMKPSGYTNASYDLGILDPYTKCALLHVFDLLCVCVFNDRRASN